MNETLKTVLSLSLSGSLIMLILFLFRPVLKERLSKRWQYYIWLVVIARLLLPFAPEINLMGTLFQESGRNTMQTEFFTPPMQQGSASTPEVDLSTDGSATDEQDTPKSGALEPTGSADNPAQNIPLLIGQNLWLGWLVVALILFIRKITIYQSFVKYIRAGCVEVADINLLEQFGKLTEQSNIKTAVELHTNSLISTPLLIGFFRPCIVLPTADLSVSDFQYTVLHELMHYTRRDMFYKWLVQFTICLHWFNPLVYFMSREVGRACELSCDEAVIRTLDPVGRRAYGDTLLNAMSAGGNYKDSIASVTLNESKERLKERLDAIMCFKKASRKTVVISVALGLTLCFGATAAGAYSAASASTQNQQISKDAAALVKQKALLIEKIESNHAPQPQTQPQTIIFTPNAAGKIVIPVSIETMSENTAICVGEIPDLANVTSIDYNITCSSNQGVLSAGLRNPTLDSEWFFRVEKEVSKNNDSVQSHFDNSVHSKMGAYKNYTGNYQFYIQNKGGELSHLSGSITIQYQPEQPVTSAPSPTMDGNLTLVTKEYTMDELKTLDISGVVVDALWENVTIVRGGNTLKFEYYIKSQDEYTISKEDDGGKTRWNLCLSRITPIAANENSRPITVSIPEGFDITLFSARTESGDIDFKNFVGKWLFAETKSGQINLNGGSVTDWMIVQTDTGNALISGTSLPASGDATLLATQTGTIAFQPKDAAQNYRFIVDTGADALVTVNGKKYSGGDYEINTNATKHVYFDSPSGSLVVQDLNQGELLLPTATRSTPIAPPAQPTAPTHSSNLTLVKKEYTKNDLQQMGITGVRIEATTENIVVNQGGDSLLITYYQASGTDYSLDTWDYEMIRGEFTTPEDISMNGGKSGTVKELKLVSAISGGAARTIYITLPSDPQYSRVVQLLSGSGQIQMTGCKSAAMITADTESGNIGFSNCSAPRLGVKTRSGAIDVNGCTMKKLNSSIIGSGTMSLQLAEQTNQYRIEIETKATTQIVMNGKTFPGGNYIRNEGAPNNIYFDCYGNGSLVITENIKQQ